MSRTLAAGSDRSTPHEGSPQFVSVHDHREDHTAEEVRESAYRRGYHQGVDMTLRLLDEGVPRPTLGEWLQWVCDWRFRLGRYRAKRSTVQPPPRIVGGKIEKYGPMMGMAKRPDWFRPLRSRRDDPARDDASLD